MVGGIVECIDGRVERMSTGVGSKPSITDWYITNTSLGYTT